jgi:uncharacterized protein (TIGR03435 family)
MKVLSSLWNWIAPALGDHLWQSTVVALVAALLTLALRKNHARARYWLWLAASLKFLVPFSFLVMLGGHLAWWSAAVTPKPSVYYTVEEISQPFTQASFTGPARSQSASASLTQILSPVLMSMWLAGCLAILCVWYARWRRISGEVEHAVPMRYGREVQILQRLQGSAVWAAKVELRLSDSTLEPGIFGVRRPVLVWPEGISEHLDDAQLEAVIAHELWHVRRRDNLAAAFHMVVEAIFWFHPLVWWMGARLVDERERACDEEVIESGSQAQTYAESILKVCEFCVGSPLPCVSGVTGADLKKRMVHIMSEHVVRELDFTRRLLLGTVAAAVLAAPLVFGVFHATPVRAQGQEENTSSDPGAIASAMIKPTDVNTPTDNAGKTRMVRMMISPEGFDARNVTLRALIQEAYGVQANQVIGGPEWLDSAGFDVDVKTKKPRPNDANPEKLLAENAALSRSKLRGLLADRAKLALHTAIKDLEIYSLVVADNGPKLQAAVAEEAEGMNVRGPDRVEKQQMRMQIGANQMYAIGAQGMSTDDLAQQLSRQLGAPVVNKTGLQGRYDFNLHWTPSGGSSEASAGSEGANDPSLSTAIQEQLGLKLEPQKTPTQVLVIDHVEKPEQN